MRLPKKIIIAGFILSLLFTTKIHAEYLLPYPGPMPGNKLYKISRIVDKLQFYWHWGTIARTNYYMSLSDKYLVEAKILLEYKQYLLGVDALKRSDDTWSHISLELLKAKNEGEDLDYLHATLLEESAAHQQIIETLMLEVPTTFNWAPEKQASTDLQLQDLLRQSLEKRKRV